MRLDEQLKALPLTTFNRLASRGFDPLRLQTWAATVGVDRDRRNRLPGVVEPPGSGDINDAPTAGTAEHSRLALIGLAALKRGEIALCVLAGGMATRMGGVVKALVEALPGKTFLDIRLAEVDHLRKTAGGRAVPLWLMTSEATNDAIRRALGDRLDPDLCATFEQHVALRVTPEGSLFLEDDGDPSVYATGHGDLPDALRASGLLESFIQRGGKYIVIANLDNLGASVDPAIIGWHIEHRGDLTVEVVNKVGSDKGGGPVRWNGKRIIAEDFRLPIGFDASTVPVFNTNTFIVNARALQELSLDWTYLEVEKKIGERRAIQFERLLGEVTVGLEPRFLRVPREGAASRFLPVKDVQELERRRPEIELIAKSRGIVA